MLALNGLATEENMLTKKAKQQLEVHIPLSLLHRYAHTANLSSPVEPLMPFNTALVAATKDLLRLPAGLFVGLDTPLDTAPYCSLNATAPPVLRIPFAGVLDVRLDAIHALRNSPYAARDMRAVRVGSSPLLPLPSSYDGLFSFAYATILSLAPLCPHFATSAPAIAPSAPPMAPYCRPRLSALFGGDLSRSLRSSLPLPAADHSCAPLPLRPGARCTARPTAIFSAVWQGPGALPCALLSPDHHRPLICATAAAAAAARTDAAAIVVPPSTPQVDIALLLPCHRGTRDAKASRRLAQSSASRCARMSCDSYLRWIRYKSRWDSEGRG